MEVPGDKESEEEIYWYEKCRMGEHLGLGNRLN